MSINPAYGTLKDFARFLKEAHRRGIRVITELVLNHTSADHAWFQRSRRAAPGTQWRDFYVWSDTPEPLLRRAHHLQGLRDLELVVGSGRQGLLLAPLLRAPARSELRQPRGAQGAPQGHRLLARARRRRHAPRRGALPLRARRHQLREPARDARVSAQLRKHVDERFRDRMLLAEANQWPEDAAAYFGRGDECHMNFHFPLMPRMFMAVHLEDRFPIVDILRQTPTIPPSCQWATFLRNHDELTLEMVTDEDRDYMYRVYAEDPNARINLGIRRRLAPLVEGRRKIELMNAMLMSLPGTPVLYYGDEIGMGDNIYLGDRDGVRTPMQWSRRSQRRLLARQSAEALPAGDHRPRVSLRGEQRAGAAGQLLVAVVVDQAAHRAAQGARGPRDAAASSSSIPTTTRSSRSSARTGAARARGHQPVALRAGRRARPVGVPRRDAGRDVRAHAVPDDHRSALLPVARTAQLLLVHARAGRTRRAATGAADPRAWRRRRRGTRVFSERAARRAGARHARVRRRAALVPRQVAPAQGRRASPTSCRSTGPRGRASSCSSRSSTSRAIPSSTSCRCRSSRARRRIASSARRRRAVVARLCVRGKTGELSEGLLVDGIAHDTPARLMESIKRRTTLVGEKGQLATTAMRAFKRGRRQRSAGAAAERVRADQLARCSSATRCCSRSTAQIESRPEPRARARALLHRPRRQGHAAHARRRSSTSGPSDKESATLATVQELVPNEGVAWNSALASIDRYFERVLQDRAALPAAPPLPTGTLLQQAARRRARADARAARRLHRPRASCWRGAPPTCTSCSRREAVDPAFTPRAVHALLSAVAVPGRAQDVGAHRRDAAQEAADASPSRCARPCAPSATTRRASTRACATSRARKLELDAHPRARRPAPRAGARHRRRLRDHRLRGRAGAHAVRAALQALSARRRRRHDALVPLRLGVGAALGPAARRGRGGAVAVGAGVDGVGARALPRRVPARDRRGALRARRRPREGASARVLSARKVHLRNPLRAQQSPRLGRDSAARGCGRRWRRRARS